jgi:O-succinylbenzoic acid--CoA ligase
LFFNWDSSDNQFALNPRLPADQSRTLLELPRLFQSEFKAHLFLLTSGTTAKSVQDLKWVALSKEAILSSAHAINHHLQSTSSDVWLHNLPDFHVGGVGIWARSYLSGAKVIKLESWRPDHFLSEVQSHHVSLTALVPAQIYDLIQLDLACPPSLRAVVVGGGALSDALYVKGRQLGWPLLPSYGMTETCSQIATASLSSLVSSSQNLRSSPPLEVLSHLNVETHVDGRLRIRGSSLLTAYLFYGDAGPVMIDPKEEGWFYSQDRGEVIGRSLKILGRVGDFVKIGGESVEVGRLRAILDEIRFQLNLTTDFALLPVPDDRLGYVIHLLAQQDAKLKDILRLVESFNSRVIAFEKIRKWHTMERIPRTDLGKLIAGECLQSIQNFKTLSVENVLEN